MTTLDEAIEAFKSGEGLGGEVKWNISPHKVVGWLLELKELRNKEAIYISSKIIIAILIAFNLFLGAINISIWLYPPEHYTVSTVDKTSEVVMYIHKLEQEVDMLRLRLDKEEDKEKYNEKDLINYNRNPSKY